MSIQIQTAQNVSLRFEPAGVGERIIAAAIDIAIIIAYVAIIGIAAFAVGHSVATLLWFFYIPVLFYDLLCEVFFNGQSIGKSIRNIRVVRLDGGRPTLGQYVLRWLLRFVDLTLSSGAVAILLVMFTKRSQRLGDIVAGTTVVRVKSRTELNETIYSSLTTDYEPVFPQVELLSDEDAQLARDVLNSIRAEGRTVRSRNLGRKLKTSLEARMNVTSDLPPEVFLQTVIRDYNAIAGRV